MPRILRIINRFNIGGPTYNVAYLTKYMPPEYETLLVGGMPEASEEGSAHVLSDLGIEPVLIGDMKRELGLRDDYTAYRKLRYIIHKFKPDIVHTHASKAGALGRLAARNEGVPLVVHTFHGHVFHSYFGKAKTYFFKSVERNLARRTDRIIAISDRQKDELAIDHKICSADKISVVPLGFDLTKFWTDQDLKRADFRAKYHLDEDDIAVGIIGRLVPIKNHVMFLEAARKVLAQTSKKVRFFIIGDGESREMLMEKSRSIELDTVYLPNGQAHSVTFTSWIRDADWAMAGLDVVALTSFNEGTPVSLIEAQASSRAIVSTRVGGIENIVQEGRSALLSQNDHADQFASNLLSIIENDDLRMELSQHGKGFVEKRFHYTRLVDDMTSLYASLLAGVPIGF